MRILLALGVLVLGFVATAEEAKPDGKMAQATTRARLMSKVVPKDDRLLHQAKKEAEIKFNCKIAHIRSQDRDFNWNANTGKPFICLVLGGVWMKFDENGRLVKAGKKELFEEIEWMNNRWDELDAESRQKDAAPKVKAPTDSGKGESTSLKTDQK